MQMRALLDRIPTGVWLAVIAVAMVASFRLGLGARDTAAGGGPEAGPGSVAGLRVRLADGRDVPVAPARGSAVVMVSSVSCTFCDEALRDVARTARGRALPGLRVVTLEGADAGASMLARHGLGDVWHAGPAGDGASALLTFQFPGTPTFLLVDASGAVRAALPGYPGREAFAPWVRVMTGEADGLTRGGATVPGGASGAGA
ncbi:MAG TPA: hypothetical protein VFS08_00395 [Gemmatimonadaceae bacterium]|nr:hypothetical protein [Gemmatimonadaceae bacterium]